MKSVTLYKKTATGAIHEWSIRSRDEAGCIFIRYGQLNGLMQEQIEQVKTNKSGRSLLEQVASRVNSRISMQKAKGYRNTIAEALKYTDMNELNLFKPMLAQKLGDQKSIDTKGAVLQYKLDGNRMMATKQNGGIILYSRNGKLINTLDHIKDQLEWMKEGQTIDGEVYKHGMPLKDIRGGIAKKQDSTKNLEYHVYDVIDDRPFKERFAMVHDAIHFSRFKNVKALGYYKYDEHDMKRVFDMARANGYEGLMMRLDNCGYDVGKRSKSLLKIKARHDAEYQVIDVEVAKNGAGVLVMILPNGSVVRGLAPGSFEDKVHVASHPERYISKWVTCSYAYITDFGIPFHLTCDSWRE